MAAVGDAELGEADAGLHGAQRERVVVELELLLVGEGDVGPEAGHHGVPRAPAVLDRPPRGEADEEGEEQGGGHGEIDSSN
jgi:hypothetical protein